MFVWLWFHVLVLFFLVLDLSLLKKKFCSNRQIFFVNFGWIVLALIFNGWIYGYLGFEKAKEFLMSYVIEKALSIDNVFVFGLIFSFFKLPKNLYEKVLLHGVVAAICFRLMMIVFGVYLIDRLHWLSYVLGAFVVFLGLKWLFEKKEKSGLRENSWILSITKSFRVTSDYVEDKYFVIRNNLYYMTPLLLVLIVIEISDVIFAFDSVPTVLTITQDPFIAYTSNVFAILGMRALYFWVSSWAFTIDYLKKWIAVICIGLGLKMMLTPFF